MIDYILNKRPLDGLIDSHGNDSVRLRIGIVDDPTVNRPEGTPLDPLNPVGAVNMSTGKICVRWLDIQGGIIRPPQFGGKTDSVSYEVPGHGKVVDVQSDGSEREMLTLTHPIMWANDKRWFGINYLPPVGSVVVIGFRKQNIPVLLGFLQPNYAICHPIKLGEMMFKGYGNNYIYLQQSDKIEMHTWSIAGEVDLSDPNKSKKNAANCDIYLKMNANDQEMTLSVGSTSIVMTPSSITLNTTDFIVNGTTTFNGTVNGLPPDVD